MAENRYELNKNLAQMLKGGVIMDVQNPEQAQIAEAAGAAAVMALERIPADIRAVGGVSRMSDPKMIKETKEQLAFQLWQKLELDISLRLRFWKLLKLTISMRVKCFLQLTTVSMWTRKNSKYLCMWCQGFGRGLASYR